jgi:hypothetical protein
VYVAGKVVQDFKRQVSERLLGALDPLARIGLCKCDSEVFSDSLGLAACRWRRNVDIGSFGKSVEELDALA